MKPWLHGVLLAGLTVMPTVAQENGGRRVTLGGILVVEFRASAGGYTPEQRRAEMQSRVVEVLSQPNLVPSHVRFVVAPNGRSARVMVGQMLLVTATRADAEANRSTPEKLARVWAENFRRAFEAARPKRIPGA